MNTQVLLMAKTPAPGKVKTRLTGMFTSDEAARFAAAAITDTVAVLSASDVEQRWLVVDGDMPAPEGWKRVSQRGDKLADRLVAAFTDTWLGGASILVGMDTPQMTTGHIEEAKLELATSDCVIGLSEDGGWWLLALKDPEHAKVLEDVATSAATTGEDTIRALAVLGLRVASISMLRDVDTPDDVYAVAAKIPDSEFARTLARIENS